MNNGTKIRTALIIAVSVHTALLATDITGFANPTIDLIYKVVSIAVNFVVVALTTYYNNDYTYEGALGTTLTRQLKAEAEECSEIVEEDENWSELQAEEDSIEMVELEDGKGSDE